MKEIVIGGKTRPIVFGMSTLAAYCHEKRIALTRMEQAFADMTLQDTIDLIYHALVSGARRYRIEPDFDRVDVTTWIDEDTDAFAEAMRIFSESQQVQGTPAQDKKKAGRRA
jgi:hypothetical protein